MSQVRIDGCLGEEFEVIKGLRRGGGGGGVIPGSLFLVHQQFGN